MESIALVAGLFVVAVVAYALGRGRRVSFEEFRDVAQSRLPELEVGVPITFQTPVRINNVDKAGRREFVPTHITYDPRRTIVEMQDRASYEREHRVDWPGA